MLRTETHSKSSEVALKHTTAETSPTLRDGSRIWVLNDHTLWHKLWLLFFVSTKVLRIKVSVSHRIQHPTFSSAWRQLSAASSGAWAHTRQHTLFLMIETLNEIWNEHSKSKLKICTHARIKFSSLISDFLLHLFLFSTDARDEKIQR